MTKEEQIINDPNLAPYVDKNRCWIHEAFMDGVRWADKATINKAIDILIDMSNDGVLIDVHNHEEFEKQFRKAMEDE